MLNLTAELSAGREPVELKGVADDLPDPLARGLSEANGSWKITCISRHNGCISLRAADQLLASVLTEPAVGSSSWIRTAIVGQNGPIGAPRCSSR